MDRWLQRRHPRISEAVQIPAKSNSDQWRSTSVLPYLQVLYEPPSLSAADSLDDSLNRLTVAADVCPHASESENNNNINNLSSNSETRVRGSRCRPSSSRTSTFLSCLGFRKDKCKQS